MTAQSGVHLSNLVWEGLLLCLSEVEHIQSSVVGLEKQIQNEASKTSVSASKS